MQQTTRLELESTDMDILLLFGFFDGVQLASLAALDVRDLPAVECAQGADRGHHVLAILWVFGWGVLGGGWLSHQRFK